MPRLVLIVSTFAALLLAGCEIPGMGESAEKQAAAREAEGKAVGGACRHAGRAIEDCYLLNKRVDKASIFAGWRDMNDYMRENKIEEVPPQIAGVAAKPLAEDAPEAHAEKRPAKGGEGKSKDKPKARES